MKISDILFKIFFFRSIRKHKNNFKNFIQNYNPKLIDLTQNGFRILTVNPASEINIKWDDIDDVELENKRIILFSDNKIKYIIQESEYMRWYELIKNIPAGYPRFDYNYVNQFFKNLTGCEICGHLSVNNGECLSCGSEVWNDELAKMYNSKREYIIEEQLDIFSPDDEDEKNLISNELESGFSSDPNWKPLISQDDIKK